MLNHLKQTLIHFYEELQKSLDEELLETEDQEFAVQDTIEQIELLAETLNIDLGELDE